MNGTSGDNVIAPWQDGMTHDGLNDRTLPGILTSNCHNGGEHVVVDFARDILQTLETLGQNAKWFTHDLD